jgi:Fic family protein
MLFTLNSPTPKELEIIGRINRMRETLRHNLRHPRHWTGLLRRVTLARAIQGSNSIEGYNVSIEDAIAAAENAEPALDPNTETWRAILGYRRAMTYVLQLANDPHFSFNETLIKGLHFMMLDYDMTKHPGTWRPGWTAVKNDQTGAVVYEGPDVEKVPALMHELADSLNAPDELPLLLRGALAHLNLAMIHPFSDGNGRMARCLQSLVLAREKVLEAEFCSIEEYLGTNTQAYYDVLAEVGAGAWHPERDAHPWIKFVLTAHFHQANTLLRRLQRAERVWGELAKIQKAKHLPERMVFALFDAASGLKVRNPMYRSVAGVTLNLASRDLAHLAEMGLLVPHGEKRGRYYVASPQILEIYRLERDRERRSEEDPFAESAPMLPGLG